MKKQLYVTLVSWGIVLIIIYGMYKFSLSLEIANPNNIRIEKRLDKIIEILERCEIKACKDN